MKLYYSKGACSLSPHIALYEAGLVHTAVLASTKTHTLEDGTDFHTINPLGYVPVLELIDGTRLTEGPAIVQWIADQVPGKNLAPENGTIARYQMQSWLTFIGTELHKTFTPLFRPETPEAYKTIARDKLLSRLQYVDGQLAGKNYLMGNNFTVADAYLFTVSNWTVPMKVDISGMPNLIAFRSRMSTRPAVQAAMKAEGLM
jgi:glutathione S-transferase